MIVAIIAGCALTAAPPTPVKLISPLPTALLKQRVAPTKEPKYSGSPRYGLITIDGGKAKVWFVVDGTQLYMDKNGNGDLTDDGPAIASKKLEHFTSPHVFFEWPSMAPKGTTSKLTDCSLFVYVRGTEYRIADFRTYQNGVFWFYRNRGCVLAAKAAEAPILNWGAPYGLLFDFINGTDGTLSKSKANEFYIQIGSQGSEVGSFVCRSYEDMPKDTTIEANFEFVDKRDNSKKLNMVAQLRTRC
jgi:hypothetical protein